jgi:hypothetical protein
MKEQRKAARNARDKARQEADDLRRKLEKYESANKSELQRLIDERDALKEQLGQVSSVNKRRDIAEEFAPEHALPKHVRLVAKYLSGSTDEELEASAEELYAQFAPAPRRRRRRDGPRSGCVPATPIRKRARRRPIRASSRTWFAGIAELSRTATPQRPPAVPLCSPRRSLWPTYSLSPR